MPITNPSRAKPGAKSAISALRSSLCSARTTTPRDVGVAALKRCLWPAWLLPEARTLYIMLLIDKATIWLPNYFAFLT